MLTVAALGAALTTFLPAQTAATPNANQFIPENSALVVRIASPAKWRKQFGETQVARLGEANSLAPFMGMAGEQIDMGMSMLRDSGMFDADLAEGLLTKWQGDIVISVQLDWDAMLDAMQSGDAPPMSFVVALTPDGSFDLGAVSKEFDRMVEEHVPADAPIKDLIVGDLTLRYADSGGNDPDFTMPAMIDGHLVMIGGTTLEKDAAKLLANEARFAITDSAPFYMHADIGRLVSTMLAANVEDTPFDPVVMMDMIGLSALKDMSLSIRPDGKAVAGDLRIGMKKQGRGMFNMLVKSNQPPKLLSSVPESSEAFSVTAMDFGAILKTVADVWGLAEDFVPMTFDDAMGMFTEATKVRLKEDLFDNLGKEVLMVQDVESLKNLDPDEMDDSPAAMFAGTVYGIALRDGDAFGTALDKIIRSRGMHVGRKTEAYANAEVNRMKIAGLVEIEYVVAKDLLLIAVGGDEATGRVLRNIIDTRSAGDAKGPAILKKRGANLAPGWNSVGVSPIGAILESAMLGLQATRQFGPEMDQVAQVVRGVVADMNRLGVGSIVQASYCDDNGFVSSFRW